MRVAIAGGHGKVALLLGQLMSPEHDVTGLIRKPGHVSDLEEAGMGARLVDLETASPSELAEAIEGFDGLVFSAGAGPGSGAARKETVDYGAAVKSIEAAQAAGVRRFVMVSAMGTDHPPGDDSVFSIYLRAKARADAALMESSLDWTVVRPGRLTDDPGTGRVHLARHVDKAEIPRADVAAVIAEMLRRDSTVGKVFEVVGGSAPIPEAVADSAG